MNLNKVRYYNGNLYREIEPHDGRSNYEDNSMCDFLKDEVIVDYKAHGFINEMSSNDDLVYTASEFEEECSRIQEDIESHIDSLYYGDNTIKIYLKINLKDML